MVPSLILDLYAIQAVKFGSFTLKSGIQSPIYVDLRQIISFPSLLKKISAALWQKAETLSFDLLCGVPYTALPIATCLSVQQDIPMVMRRKEAKEYGTKKIIEGHFQKGQRCLIVEDVVTSGASILETAQPLQEEGLIITDAVVVLNREQGGEEHLAKKGIRLHSLLHLSDLLEILHSSQKISGEMVVSVKEFLALAR